MDAKNTVEYANKDIVATSTTVFKIHYSPHQDGFNIYVNNDTTPIEAIPPANIPVSNLGHFIGVGHSVGGAINQATLRVGSIKIWNSW